MINKAMFKLGSSFKLLVVCIIMYAPLSSFLFALKNDAYIFNFPNKYFFSEALHNGHIPIWNPYLNFGFPLYADPGFAWWNPITWIFGLVGYNPYTFTIELLLYIYTAGLGMFWLGRTLKLNIKTSFAIACMFMCSGFFVGNLQHINFLTAAAFIPWVTLCWINYQAFPSWKNVIFCGIAFYLLFTAGHPAIPVATIYFISFLTILYYLYHKEKISVSFFFIKQIRLLVITLFFLTPLIISSFTIIPLYSRFETISPINNSETGITFPSIISFIIPFATIKNTTLFETDVSMRNFYISIPGLLFFLYFLFTKNKNKIQKIFLIIGISFFLFSAGSFLKQHLYSHLPGFEYIRTNGEFRVFILFCFLICAAYPLNEFFFNKLSYKKYYSNCSKWILILSIIALAFLSTLIEFPLHTISALSLLDKLKYVLDNISFYQSCFIALFVVLILSILYYATSNKRNVLPSFIVILMMDLFINTNLMLPITGVGKTSTFEIQKIIKQSVPGLPIPELYNLKQNKIISNREETIIGDWGWYNKKLNLHLLNYPSVLKSTKYFYEYASTKEIANRKYLFFKYHSANIIQEVIFKPNQTKAKLKVVYDDTLVLLQNHFPGWEIFINEQKVKPSIFNHTFLAVFVPKGEYDIKWHFTLPYLLYLVVWAILLILLIIYTFIYRRIIYEKNSGESAQPLFIG